jgi:glycosyltransferase involved in cell wall biosynthesis
MKKDEYPSPRVSVVIATYNRAKMVREAVLAAWNQTIRPNEIIVSDDCSPDCTMDVLNQLKNEVPVLKVLSSPVNSGGVPNWNKVIDSTVGDLIAWCSDDDKFHPEHLERAIAILGKNQDIGLVHSGFVNVDQMPDGSEVSVLSPLKGSDIISIDSDTIFRYLTRYYCWPFHPSTWVFRRTLWERTGVFNRSYALADTDWFIRASLYAKIVYSPTHDVYNRRHIGNWSNRVGSVGMQREFHGAVSSFFDRLVVIGQMSRGVKWQFRAWKAKYLTFLIRIFISRARAGERNVAMDCASLISESFPTVTNVPGLIRGGFCEIAFCVFRSVQVCLFWRKRQSSKIGVLVPR